MKNSNYWVFEKMLFGMILFLNGNKKRKNRRKLPFVIEVHSGGQSGEFRNFLVHCNLHKKKHKIWLKNSLKNCQITSSDWASLESGEFIWYMILFLNLVIKREKIIKKKTIYHLWLRFTPVDKVENFAIFWYIAIFKKKT